MTGRAPARPDYGVDAPNVLRNLLLFGAACLLLGLFGPVQLRLGSIDLLPRPMFFWTGVLLLLLRGLLYLRYVRCGKFSRLRCGFPPLRIVIGRRQTS